MVRSFGWVVRWLVGDGGSVGTRVLSWWLLHAPDLGWAFRGLFSCPPKRGAGGGSIRGRRGKGRKEETTERRFNLIERVDRVCVCFCVCLACLALGRSTCLGLSRWYRPLLVSNGRSRWNGKRRVFGTRPRAHPTPQNQGHTRVASSFAMPIGGFGCRMDRWGAVGLDGKKASGGFETLLIWIRYDGDGMH